jgi:hypothetical protein
MKYEDAQSLSLLTGKVVDITYTPTDADETVTRRAKIVRMAYNMPVVEFKDGGELAYWMMPSPGEMCEYDSGTEDPYTSNRIGIIDWIETAN